MSAGPRNEAKLAGRKRYFTGVPCKRGHLAERNTITGKCVACRPPSFSKMREYQARYSVKHPERVQENKYRHRYGVELSEIRPKPTACELCGQESRKIVFDHAHGEHRFRGWLCDPCNTVLGLVGENPERLRMLANYIEKHKADKDLSIQINGIPKGQIWQSRWRLKRQAVSRSAKNGTRSSPRSESAASDSARFDGEG